MSNSNHHVQNLSHTKIEQIYTGCLAHAKLLPRKQRRTAIFDPLRGRTVYPARRKGNAKIKYVFETHFHADFVSGHWIRPKNGRENRFRPYRQTRLRRHSAEDNQVFKVGDYSVKIIHTPGHTMESTTCLLIDENGKRHGIISGDTLFIGDVGRPDLAQHVIADLTRKAGRIPVRSLRNKNRAAHRSDPIVYPNHGQEVPCGKT
ncbi:MAG: MBL fold metallo-hydrolase [Lewinellaceae bacterium]|nr:MBL fold metallo-hydrolase [Lewinellaceae bacterium]